MRFNNKTRIKNLRDVINYITFDLDPDPCSYPWGSSKQKQFLSFPLSVVNIRVVHKNRTAFVRACKSRIDVEA